jgi:hypothetical protein
MNQNEFSFEGAADVFIKMVTSRAYDGVFRDNMRILLEAPYEVEKEKH